MWLQIARDLNSKTIKTVDSYFMIEYNREIGSVIVGGKKWQKSRIFVLFIIKKSIDSFLHINMYILIKDSFKLF
jgi:hypothetical protein